MHDLYSEKNIRKGKLIMDRFFGELIESTESVDVKTEQGEVRDKNFFWNESKIETMPEIEERLNELGIENVDLRGTKEIWQKKIAASVESMFESHPELQGCLGCIRTAKLGDGVYACTGPRMTENGISSEIQLNEKIFSKSDLELKIVDMQIENFRGETWFAGKGLDGVLKHEMAHIMHLKMIADKEEISFGDTDKEKYELLSQGYYRNSVVAKLCNDSLKELDISPKDPPMPYVLERAIYSIYEECGWDITNNKNEMGEVFPTIEQLYYKIPIIVEEMGYDYREGLNGE